LDPLTGPGLVDIAIVSLRSQTTGAVLWRANRSAGLEELSVRGTALRLPHQSLLRLLSYGDDPQVYLPDLTGKIFDEPLTLQVLLRFDPAPTNIERAVSGWNDLVAASSGLPLSKAWLGVPSPGSAERVLQRPASGQVTLAVYSAGDTGYSEDRTTQVAYALDRWSHLTVALQLGLGSMPLRLTPLTSFGLIDVASLTLRSALNDEILWRANGGGELATLQISGSAVRIPHPNLARILSYGEDPQIYLPAFPRGRFDGPLRLEVWIKTETGPDSIRKGISELASINSQAMAATTRTQCLLEESNQVSEAEIKELRSALAFTTAEFDKSRGELRSQITETAARSKETERVQLELEARTSRVEQASSELALLRNQLGVEHSAKVRMAEEFTRLGKELSSLKQQLDARKRRFPRKLFTTKDKEKGDLGPKLKGNTSEYRFWLDFPTGPTLASENVVFSGWVLPPPGEKILGVRALVQEEEVVGQYGFERSDVAAAFSDRPEGLYPGFSVAMPLSVGSHEVALQVLIGTAKWVTFYLHRHEVLAHPSNEG
jgi:hypothetical protein